MPTPADTDAAFMRRAILLIAIITLARLVIILVTPIELAGDEAQYWDWSRRLDLSYYSKGPGVAWTIAASTGIFGDHEWAVRLPAVLAGTVTLICGGWLAAQMRPGAKGRAAFTSTLALIAIPALHGASLLMTIDSPYVACWALSCALAWRTWARITQQQRAMPAAIALGLALGVAFLYKYTAIILPIGLCAFAILRRCDVPRARSLWFAISTAAGTAALCTLPVIIWNAQHNWPTLRHLMGHLAMAGGDLPAARNNTSNVPMWTIEYLGAQLGVVGPILVLMAIASIRAIRRRHANAERWSQDLFLLLAGWPVFLFYLFVSFKTDIEANWPLAGVVTLAILVARAAERDRTSHAEPARQKSAWQRAWHASIVFGIVAVLFLGAAPWLGHAPVIGKLIPLDRVSGARDLARAVDAVRATHPQAPIIAAHYQTTARLAFYLPDHPPVRCASAFLGDRASSYDHFADTRLDDPALLAREVILVGKRTQKWERSRLHLANLRIVDESNRIAVARFEGLRLTTDHAP